MLSLVIEGGNDEQICSSVSSLRLVQPRLSSTRALELAINVEIPTREKPVTYDEENAKYID